ncbi:unnamed protein product [Chondrus crispus]|uniref:F-box domain-containing protein n=1 Tax=Chondrus crispus TaxID=2769 RepID=R7QDN7_CHOCR|nr:unnamed protein product [Chondrus crispus]CDF36627.1 unnamed protein product [Chondrus crispus]|eukprot:XP_005716446.1 unnamed protein product [Chondrus crispus]
MGNYSRKLEGTNGYSKKKKQKAFCREMPTRLPFQWFGDGAGVGVKSRPRREGAVGVGHQAPLTLLSLPDDLLLLLFRHLLSTPCPTLPLSARALESSASAFALAGACSRLRMLFRLCVPSLAIDWHTPVYPHVLASTFAPALRALQVHGHPRADVLLRELAAHPGPLKLKRLGSDAVSNAGMGSLLRGCGKTLTHFTWESPRCRMRGSTRTGVGVAVGVANLSAKVLARTLAANCPNLLRVEVNGLRPRERVERGRCDLAFMELEEDVKKVDVFIDYEHLSFEGNLRHAVLDERYKFN